MRRKKQQLSDDETEKILKNCKTGVLALCGDDEPYAVPLNYVYFDSKIYFHCAKQGRKLDEIEKNTRVSFCVVEQDEVIPEKFTTRYRSAVAFGNARVLTGGDEFFAAINALINKYSPNVPQNLQTAEIEKCSDRTAIVAVDIEYFSGKQGGLC